MDGCLAPQGSRDSLLVGQASIGDDRDSSRVVQDDFDQLVNSIIDDGGSFDVNGCDEVPISEPCRVGEGFFNHEQFDATIVGKIPYLLNAAGKPVGAPRSIEVFECSVLTSSQPIADEWPRLVVQIHPAGSVVIATNDPDQVYIARFGDVSNRAIDTDNNGRKWLPGVFCGDSGHRVADHIAGL
jgi:hypothetical protein